MSAVGVVAVELFVGVDTVGMGGGGHCGGGGGAIVGCGGIMEDWLARVAGCVCCCGC